jgi:hypothetical protein
LYDITDELAKLRYGVLHLDKKTFAMVAMEKNFSPRVIASTHFVAKLYEHFDTDTNHLGHLTNLKQSGTVEDFIATFEQLDFCTEGMSDVFF